MLNFVFPRPLARALARVCANFCLAEHTVCAQPAQLVETNVETLYYVGIPSTMVRQLYFTLLKTALRVSTM